MADLAVDLKTNSLIVTCDCKRIHTINGNGEDSFTIETKEETPIEPPKKGDNPTPEPKGKNPIFGKLFHS